MARRSSSDDPRSLRLRALIKGSALALVRARPACEITLNDLLADSGVSRQGFYEHFSDRDDALFHAITDDFADTLHSERVSSLSINDLLLVLTRFIDQRRDIYLNLRRSSVFDDVLDQWRSLLLPEIRRLVCTAGPRDSDDIEETSIFILGGIVDLSRDWLRTADPATPARQAEIIWRQLTRLLSVLPAHAPGVG